MAVLPGNIEKVAGIYRVLIWHNEKVATFMKPLTLRNFAEYGFSHGFKYRISGIHVFQ